MNVSDWARIDDLFHRAIELPAEQRKEFVEIACESPAIRAEVLAMLQHDTPADGIFEQTVAAAAVAMVSEKRTWVIGRRIGPYRVTGIIGEGGMGTVYAAVRDDDAYQKEVAIKLVRHGLETGRILERFRAERQILARLEHPYIARMLDGGATDEGMPYLVMERINGTPITAYANQHELNLQGRLQLFLKVCEAVQYAHASLVIHRDIKPANILITPDGTPRLLDFGLARVLGDDTSGPQTTGAFLMTPEYASPEQVEGRAITTSSDVYSLGAVLYQLLTGRAPHALAGLSAMEAATVILKSEAEPPSRVAANPLVPARQLRGDLDNILLMALRKDPARRYRSVEQFAADLQRYEEGIPVLARADTLGYRVAKFSKRNRWPLVAAAAVFLALTFGIVTSQQSARRERRRFDQVRQLVNRVLFEVHDAVRPLSGSLAARELIVNNALQYLNSLSADAAGDPELLNELADAYRKLGTLQGSTRQASRGDHRAALASFQKGVALSRQALARQPRNPTFLASLGAGLLEVMRVHADSSQLPDARAAGEEAVTVLERAAALRPEDPVIRQGLIQSYSFLGVDVLAPTNELPAAVALVRKGIALSEQLAVAQPTSANRDQLASSHVSLGRMLALLRDVDGSRKAYQRAVDIREQLVTAQPDNTELRRSLMITYGGQADRIAEACTEERVPGAAAARPIYEKMVALARSLNVDPKDRTSKVDLAHTVFRLGCLEDNEGNFDKAIERLNEGLASIQPFADPESAPTALLLLRHNLLVRLGRVRLEQNRVAEAALHFAESSEVIRALERRAPGLPELWIRRLAVDSRLALVWARRRDRASLDAVSGRVRAEFHTNALVKIPPTFVPTQAMTHGRLAEAYEMLGDAKAACPWWRTSREVWQLLATTRGVPPGLKTQEALATRHAAACER